MKTKSDLTRTGDTPLRLGNWERRLLDTLQAQTGNAFSGVTAGLAHVLYFVPDHFIRVCEVLHKMNKGINMCLPSRPARKNGQD